MAREKIDSGRKPSARKTVVAIACVIAGLALACILGLALGVPAYVRWAMDHMETTYPGMRALTRRIPPSSPIKMASVKDILVPGPSGQVPVKVYSPPRLRDGAPDMLYMHGGGFVIGCPELVDRFCRSLARDCACRVYSVDYRLAPEYPYPIAVNECYAVLGWLRTQPGPVAASSARKIVVAGDSAGANLATVLSLMCRDRGDPAPLGQILVCPPVGSLPAGADGSGSSRDGKAKSVLSPSSLDFFGRAYLGDPAKRRDDPYVNPIRAASLAGLPPALIFTCGRDPLREEGRAYAKRLAESGVAVTAKDFPDQDHDYQGPETIALAAAFMAGF
jgi:acetyl esterase